ncbi:hypothetical protein THRCLA_07178 [Thraustotheca clavata]|uniref:Uncharacterized protein n=1 Tax=Thraustotheca clavata TaxID=74557 RepID=A0A1V9ZFF8_9STRA|nr:hypothetical protein THRCLA_07178 [Thraustotheca clavata]
MAKYQYSIHSVMYKLDYEQYYLAFKFKIFWSRIKSLYNNSIKSIEYSSNNPIETFAHVKLSRALQFISLSSVKLQNITIDEDTANTINALKSWNGSTDTVGFAIDSNVMTDPMECAAISGDIKQLFEKQTTYNITACVLPWKPDTEAISSKLDYL